MLTTLHVCYSRAAIEGILGRLAESVIAYRNRSDLWNERVGFTVFDNCDWTLKVTFQRLAATAEDKLHRVGESFHIINWIRVPLPKTEFPWQPEGM
jgi:hypothetical protein